MGKIRISCGVGNERRVSTFSSIIQYKAENPPQSIRQDREVKEMKTGKEEVKLCLLVDDMILF
jgi:hypothetical protein